MLATIGLGFALTVIGFKVVVPEDPYAHLDDTYLSTLKDDDDLANAAAQKVLVCEDTSWLLNATRSSRLLMLQNTPSSIRARLPSCCGHAIFLHGNEPYFAHVDADRLRRGGRTDQSTVTRVTTKPWWEVAFATRRARKCD